MAEEAEQSPEAPLDADPAQVRVRRRWPTVLAIVAGLLLLLAWAWISRVDIAGKLISGQLEDQGLPATYRIEEIGTDRQVLRDVVVGDPRHPDLTIERIEMAMESRWGLPWPGRITFVRPRLYGSYRDGKLSFGSLDTVLFRKTGEPFQLPDLDIAIIDGRARLDTGFGPAGMKAEGAGRLRDGFSGVLAAVAPQVDAGGCRADRTSLFGKLVISGEKPRFTGPLRLGGLECQEAGLRLGLSAMQLDAMIDPRFDGGEAKLSLQGGALALGGSRLGGTAGSIRATYRMGALTARYDLTGKGLDTPQAALSSLALEGVLRAQDRLSRVELEGEVTGGGFRPGRSLESALASVQRNGEGTLVAPLATRLRSTLSNEERGSRLSAAFILRRTGGITNLVVPQATLRGGSGQTLLAISRLQLTGSATMPPRLAGNFSTGGEGLPRISGRLERGADDGLMARLTMAEYRVGSAMVAVPELMLVQTANGALGLAGEARLSGALPGGEVNNLVLPLDGNWSAARGLALWRKCTSLRFDSLALANLRLERRSVTLCPPAGGRAILRSGAGGTRIAAGAPSLDIAGRLGETPVRIASGPIGFAVPGNLSARALDVALGPADTASRFRIANLSARIGKDITGTFEGSEIRLAAVPLDLLDANGEWRFTDGRLTIANGAFRLEDRQVDDRFQPLVANDGTLELAENRIVAEATLREPGGGREIVRTSIRHDLSTGKGDAGLFVDGVTFDTQLQPDTLTRLALGVIANAGGVVRGTGRIGWTPAKVTSSGSFSTDSLDFAAAFGPVKGLSGTVVFTDLIGLVTAPDQRLRIASVNPGIEANDGEISFELRPESVLAVNGASWPFLDGRLTLEPTRMVLGAAEVRRYTLNIDGLDAAKFVQRLELGNLVATGTFDGRLPLVFDENGGRIEDGLLVSRPPGGNVSYVGQLTYKDLSAMGNFAFDALRSIDYRQMRIEMNGALEGEIITRVGFEGLSQGAGARRNFVTKQVAKLPIRFTVNLRAPFFRLVSSFKSLYDPAYIRDPRMLGLIGSDGKSLNPAGNPSQVSVQPPVSETKP